MKKERKNQRLAEQLTVDEIRRELDRTQYRRRFHAALRGTVFTLVVAAAIAILVATLLLPVLRTYGMSMSPTLQDGDLVVSVKTSSAERGDIIAFYYNNKILIKRVIALSGEWIDVDADGTVFINNVPLEEPYVSEPALGECTIKLPYQVPDNRLFVMGDHRATSVDSRSIEIGCVSEEQIVGKLVFKIWPLNDAGEIK